MPRGDGTKGSFWGRAGAGGSGGGGRDIGAHLKSEAWGGGGVGGGRCWLLSQVTAEMCHITEGLFPVPLSSTHVGSLP